MRTPLVLINDILFLKENNSQLFKKNSDMNVPGNLTSLLPIQTLEIVESVTNFS